VAVSGESAHIAAWTLLAVGAHFVPLGRLFAVGSPGRLAPSADPDVTATDIWYYNESSVSRAGLSGSTTLSDIRQANTNLTQGINNCGFTQGAFEVKGAYSGTTSKFANINSASQCTSNFPDGQDTVSWGPFDTNHSSTLAYTCYHWHTNANGYPAMDEADTYLGSNRSIVDSFPQNCSNKYDLQSVMTHEWGHAYGLAHETSGADEVMYPTKFSCNDRRHLGSGDYSGMASLYP
jgi:Matrixin